MEKLAILGGRPVLNGSLPVTNNIGDAEKQAVLRVLDSGVLSDYVGRAGEKFLGGKEVNDFERAFRDKFKVRFAVSFNSATTALDAAVCSLGIGPGDEVIVSPYTMSASATAILMNMAIPVFADIDDDTFCLDPASVRKKITPRTKAILVTNIFGGSARYDEILKIAKENNIRVIEDNAQAPAGQYHGRFLGTVGDVGVFSFNFHKVVHCGEGGVLVTNNERYAFRARLKRNHGEAVLDDLDDRKECVLGSNYRLTELQAAIAHEQLKKLDSLNETRIQLAEYLTGRLGEFEGITPAYLLPDTRHVYYVYPFRFDRKKVGISRDLFVQAMAREGFLLNAGYLKPLHLMSMFKKKKVFERSNCPFDCKHYNSVIDYKEGDCPVAERLWRDEFLFTSICRHPLTKEHIDLFVAAIRKIYASIDALKLQESSK